jgi:hypothetical protein
MAAQPLLLVEVVLVLAMALAAVVTMPRSLSQIS